MAHKNRILQNPALEVYAPPPLFHRQVSLFITSDAFMQVTSPQVYIPPNPSDLRFSYHPGTSHDYQTYDGASFWSRSTSYYKCPPFIRSQRDSRNMPGVPRVSSKNSPSESADSIDHYCEVCKVNCVGKQSYTAHLAGQKHKKKLKQQEQQHKIPEEVEGKTKELQCPLCNVKCSGIDTYRAHLSGKQHQRAVKLQMARGSSVPDCETVLAGANQKNWISSSYVNPEDCIEEVLVGKVMHFRCRLCECIFSDLKAKNVHESGKRHQTAVRRFKAVASLPSPTASRSTPPAPIDEESSGSCGVTSPTQQSLSPRGPVPTSSNHSVSSSPSKSFSSGRSHVAPTVSGFARPPGPCVPPAGLQALVSLPPHVLADERYMQTKLRGIAPSEEENTLMTLAIDSVSDALRRILRAREDDADISNTPSDTECANVSESTGVFLVGPAAVGLLLGGQRTADMVLVSHELPSTDCVAEVAEELEELLKESCKNHSVTVATVEGTYVLVQMTSKSTNSADNPTATDIIVTIRLRLTSTRILDTKAGTALKQPKSGANDHYHEGRTTAAAATFATGGSGSGGGGAHDDDDEQTQFSKALLSLSPRVCRDALTDMRRALWLQGAMAAHPAKTVLQNVARLMRCLIRDSQPLSWGHFPDYVLMVLLERLSYMDLSPPDAYQGAPPRLRMGLLFRRLLECLATSALISRDGELANLPDPADTNGALLLDGMKQADRLAVTSTAQMALRLVAFRQIYKLLDVPKFVPPCVGQCVPKNGVAAKRRATGDCGFGGSHAHGRNYTASVANVTGAVWVLPPDIASVPLLVSVWGSVAAFSISLLLLLSLSPCHYQSLCSGAGACFIRFRSY
ncbi:Zinc finger RNA-binding protein [Taenia crassiceps]|uniref:Zinc finger RNA-binding protein n=1 Tax=Taenia crassiceps TaxID=6207 RepID=A0ABR4Q343_9CEST